ncbi:hypothetical protein K443DRAFT_16079 [Laccaria amethystina LaAM-08-1]|uniref:Uncharacterized protein n=1 Tax=Laccaria amethystina LaAM-08-1 TaxID=1095629 RepID=A0A0C9WKI9_9AGAR|nr:hypothetical protein K443DRAFT_16079 [Laccaria amethystina LaAM-08-1]
MEGRGSDGGGGNGGAGPSLSTVGARRLGVGGCRQPCSPFVGGGLLCPWALVAALFGGAGLSFVGGGARSHAVHVRGWGAIDRGQVVHGLSFVGVSEIGDGCGQGTHLYDNENKNDERQHRCRSSLVSTSLSATWHLEPPCVRRIDVAGTRSLSDVAL